MERGLGREPEHETDPSREGSGPRVKNEPREPADESGSRALSARSDKHDAIVVNDDQADPYDEIEDLVGTLIAGKYRVERLIGRGSTGAVYLCQHLGLDKLVALKILHREMKQNP